ncbi:hypothetical protein yc1106_03529 [Curvularia clavata]|uniref:Zn(2)-C6 fungal-type domain-containing protein n=1 Tax=Curvularia clavata TaxID=95742 RepID=A0A9Q9DRP2_CURCL|nr:hypothetical protein yc1106_03529 [Curvularia clavata]
MAGETKSSNTTNVNKQQSESQETKSKRDSKLDQSTPEKVPSKEKSTKPRHRASIACASCRDRRIRCVVPPGEKECTQCKRAGVECIIKNDDERRRPISRAYMCSLTDRVALLEAMLKERGEEIPPANHPPKTRHSAPNNEEEPASPNQKNVEHKTIQQEHSSPGSQGSLRDDYPEFEQHDFNTNSPYVSTGDADSVGSPSMLPPPKKDGMVNRLLSTRGHLSFDQLNGRLRYFGPTTNCHVHSESLSPSNIAQESNEQARRADRIIRSLPLETYDYLMNLFWQFYNPVLHVLHQEAFNEDREMGRTQFYSGFLHVCVLAMGFRFANKERPDIKRISMPGMESSLHREAKYMLDHELERPGGITSVIALLLLGDLECGVGRDNVGWMYAGMAVRLAFDIGYVLRSLTRMLGPYLLTALAFSLHLDTRLSGLPQREVEIRQMTLWACVIYDKYWALFLGRPTSMKSADLEIYHLTKQFERLGTCRPAGPEKSMETMIYEALLDLMELAGKITENMDPHSSQAVSSDVHSAVDRNQYMRMAALDREFSRWYTKLPEQLQWTPNNIATAPFSFFLLHQQYHSSLILLHRPFAIANVETQGTAATALVAALAFIKDPVSRANNMQYLECLAAALSDMAYTYQPAERMSTVLRAVMVELRGGPDPVSSTSFNIYRPQSSIVPARRGSTIDMDSDMNDGTQQWAKKRQMSSSSTARPRAGTGGARKTRTMSSSTTGTTLSLSKDHGQGTSMQHGLSIQTPTPLPPRFDDQSQTDGYIIVTPRSEPNAWVPDLSHTLSTHSAAASSSSQARHPGAWMNTDYESQDAISQLANAHFPELSAFEDVISSAALGGGRMNEGGTNLDFMPLGDAEDSWAMGKEWGGGSDLDGFPIQNTSF